MSSITNVNNNASVVNVGRTTPVSPGAQPASKSIPVVIATDQTAIPVEEQNKVQSEVALSLLGIPRAEVALGIFADVNTYDVNPSEWSSSPQYHVTGHGIQHLPTEAGALVEAPRNKTAVLTSKRFFRYQPGRVSAATFGVKSTVGQKTFSQNPSIRKFGIYDNFDGYFWETRDDCQEDNFSVVRRSQSLTKAPNSPTGIVGQSLKGGAPAGTIGRTQFDDYRIIGNGASEAIVPSTLLVKDRELITNNRFAIIDGVVNGLDTGTFYADLAAAIGGSETAASVKEKCARDLDYWVDFYLLDMEYGGTNHTKINITNYATAILPAIATYEKPTHIALGNALTGYAGLSSAAVTKLTTLTGLTNTAFNRNNGQTVAVPSISDSDYGTRGKVDTIFATKSHYWAYHVTARNGDTTAGNFVTNTVYKISSLGNTNWNAIGLSGTAAVGSTFTATGAGSGTGTADSAATYTVPSGYPYTVEELKYKCQRDIGYILGGYGNDIQGGGDSETKYNMSMYFKGGRPASADAGFGMSIYSQDGGSGNPVQAEIDRHTHLRETVLADLISYFGYTNSSSVYTKLNTLATRVIDNFSIEDTQQLESGTKGFAGNLVAMRDGIILTHSAVYDPKLLRDIEQIVAVSDTNNQFKLTKGVVQFKGHVKVKTWSNVSSVATIGTIQPGKVYKVVKVIGPKGNEFTLEDEDGTAQTFTVAQATAAGTIYIETVVPFIFPKKGTTLAIGNGQGTTKLAQDLTGTNTYVGSVDVGYHGYDPVNYRDAHNIAADGSTDTFPGGMVFPYMYASDNNLKSTDASASLRVGYVNTALDISTAAGLNTVCDQIDYVNFDPNFVTWVRFNVKPEFWGVYDYRVPRSRFSHDTLDGRTSLTNPAAKQRVYSDVATGETGTARPGEVYTVNGVTQSMSSLYNFDFTKVTMLKIEFSWYGAVGALFLAYVPVENGEARWVRVHHLRASNQYKNASLGNATLPITYTTYGGGDQYSLGDEEDANFVDRGYGSQSHSIVKYGASYYIDGGDRGTVRLYSHNNEDTADAYGKQWTIANGSYNSADNSIDIDSTSLATGNPNTNVDPAFFMGARFKSANKTDQNIKVVWADASKVYLDGVPTGTPTSMKLLVDRANGTYNLETKKIILSTQQSNAVRNRVQVYPTKLSASNLGNNPVRMRFKKTPIFQTSTVYSGTFTLNAPYTLTATNDPLSTVGVTESSSPYFDNNESLYGWFQALVDADPVTVFGRLYKVSDEYYFEILESYNGTIQLKAGVFLPDPRFEADGDTIAQTTVTKVTSEKEGLSSIKIANDTVVPIPNTGINVATIYLQAGTEQLDLSPYFDYNKEYLSFPLTDQADSLYFAIDSDTSAGDSPDQVSLGCTWEEQ